MAKTCPQCGNLNNDEVKFCTACGNSLVQPPVQSGLTGIPGNGTAAAGPGPGNNLAPKIIVVAIIVIIVIFAALILLHVSGTVSIFPTATPAVTVPATPVPEGTPDIPVQTPDMTTVTTASPALVTTTAELPGTSPTPTKEVVCPSDQRACGTDCTDIMTDRDNCGDCDVSCFEGQICRMGHCMTECSFGESNCFDGCHNLSYDAQNCGTCGNICPFGLVCNQSICTPPVKTVIPTYSG